MTTNSQNVQKINQKEEAMNNDEQLIKALYDHFSSKPMGFTKYRKQIELLLRNEIKPISSRSSMSLSSNNWRSELKSMFSGRGAKWVFVSLEEIEPTLVQFEADGIDCTDYRKNTTKLDKAWIRFNGPRVNDGVKSAAFEVRTEGSTIDHPKQLHMMPADTITSYIEAMPDTPKALKLEEDSAPMPNKSKETKSKEVKSGDLSIQEIAADLNKELALPSTPESTDPSDWESFLAVEGLSSDFDDEDIFENL
jgi:hypothetical protein